jgi:hypothetical protein
MLKLGVVGLSSGNGHPYSWSAICNGYNSSEMKNIDFPNIAIYLGQRCWPECILNSAYVDWVWCPNTGDSKSISEAANIDNIAGSLSELIENCDGVLFARDDVDTRKSMLLEVINSGKFVFVDKPLSHSREESEYLFSLQKFDCQIFTCSSLLYSNDIYLTKEEQESIGEIVKISAVTPKTWKLYSPHIIDPIIYFLGINSRPHLLSRTISSDHVYLSLLHDSIEIELLSDINWIGSIEITYIGERLSITKTFKDSFSCFKKSISEFVRQSESRVISIPREQTLISSEILSMGVDHE